MFPFLGMVLFANNFTTVAFDNKKGVPSVLYKNTSTHILFYCICLVLRYSLSDVYLRQCTSEFLQYTVFRVFSIYCFPLAYWDPISKTGDSKAARSRRSHNRNSHKGYVWQLYNGDWTGFTHPGVLTEMHIYLKELHYFLFNVHIL